MLSDWGRIQSEWSSILNALLSDAARTQSHTITLCGNTVGTWLECFRKRARSIQRNNSIRLLSSGTTNHTQDFWEVWSAGFYTTYINENCCLFLCKHISLWRDWAKRTRRMRTQIGGGTEKPTASHTDERLMGFLSPTDWKNKQTGLGWWTVTCWK